MTQEVLEDVELTIMMPLAVSDKKEPLMLQSNYPDNKIRFARGKQTVPQKVEITINPDAFQLLETHLQNHAEPFD